MPIMFSDLLKTEGIDPKQVHLVRHQHKRWGRKTPYWLWRINRSEFERYQRIQRRLVFRTDYLIASFVAPSNNDTLFIGLYAVNGVGDAPEGMCDPLSSYSVAGFHLYDLS